MDLHERAGAAGGAAAEKLQRVLLVRGGGGDGHLAVDYALAFLQEVNWHEIAKHMIANYPDEVGA